MPTSRRFKKNQNKQKFKQTKPAGKNRNKIYLAIGIIAVAAVALSAFFVLYSNVLFSTQKSTASPSPTTSPSATASPPPSSATPLTSPAGEYSVSGTKVLFITSLGDIVIQMRDDKPITTTNFVNLVRQGYYNDTTFMRVIAGFMIQGGQNTQNTTVIPTIQDEIGNDNVNSNMTIAMANTGQPNSASTQFFINVADNNDTPGFDSSYTVFGQVIYGQNVVMQISEAPVGYSTEYSANVQPVTPVTLIGAAVMP